MPNWRTLAAQTKREHHASLGAILAICLFGSFLLAASRINILLGGVILFVAIFVGATIAVQVARRL